MPLTQAQVETIKTTVPTLQDHGKEITACFYSNMLSEVPDLNNVFNHTNQENGHQAAALAGSLCAYAVHIDNLAALGPAIERISQKHASLYVQAGQYDIVGKYLLQAMEQVLGDSFTPAIHDAWATAYQQLASLMIKREEELQKEAGIWSDWRDFRIDQKIQESAEIMSFYLVPVDQKPLPSYLPGQYVSIRTSVPKLHYLQARQYSLSDMPHKDCYRISVKKETALNEEKSGTEAHPAYISNILHNEKVVGDIIQVSHPAGEFYYDTRDDGDSDAPIALISAGVGLTPDLSILNTLITKDAKRKISWIQAVRNSEVQAFGDHIKDTVKTHENVQSHVFNKHPADTDQKDIDFQFKGRMNLDMLNPDHDLFLHDRRAQYYICGPEHFMTDMQGVLLRWGVDSDRIKLEVFGTGEVSVP